MFYIGVTKSVCLHMYTCKAVQFAQDYTAFPPFVCMRMYWENLKDFWENSDKHQKGLTFMDMCSTYMHLKLVHSILEHIDVIT